MGKIKELLLGFEVGRIEFDGHSLPVYRDLNDPLFLASDVADLLDYRGGSRVYQSIVNSCEVDEIVNVHEGLTGPFITEIGLYNVLSKDWGNIGRKWRRVVHDEIVRTRKQRGLNIMAKFDEWDHELDTLYIDEETGILMQSVTVAGGDVEQVPYKREEK